MNATGATLTVVRMNGAGNAFGVIDARGSAALDDAAYRALARRLCRPDSEIGGADGLLLVGDEPGFAASMRVINADGSEAEMCGNGIRCVARYLVENDGLDERFTIATLAGPIVCDVVAHEADPPAGKGFLVRAAVATPRLPHGAGGAIYQTSDGVAWNGVEVDVGNPHLVIFVDDVDAVDLERVGAELSRHPAFPHGVNVHAAQRLSEHALEVHHFERGVGRTEACGTGAVASAAAAVARGLTRWPVDVEVPGGHLGVALSPHGAALLTGPAQREREVTVSVDRAV